MTDLFHDHDPYDLAFQRLAPGYGAVEFTATYVDATALLTGHTSEPERLTLLAQQTALLVPDVSEEAKS